MSKRQEMLDAIEVCDALKPYLDPGNTNRTEFNEAWAEAFEQAKAATSAWTKEQRGKS